MASGFLVVLLLYGNVFPLQRPVEITRHEANQSQATQWRISPSFKFDALCFLNTLTGDPFYVRYYEDEYKRVEPLLTPEARRALTSLKRKVKDENKTIISAFLSVLFSATGDQTLDDMLSTIENSRRMQDELKRTTYYSESGWNIYKSIRQDLKIIFTFLKEIHFDVYWEKNILPRVLRRIEDVKNELSQYDVIAEVERYRGFALPFHEITVYMLFYSHPHGIKITGIRYLANLRWPTRVVLQNAVHELFHPPYDLNGDRELKDQLFQLKKDAFLMDKILNHNPDYGYNSFESFIEEDCVRALEQLACESLKIASDAHRRWREEDDGIHVFAVALYSIMKEEKYNQRGEKFRDFLIRNIKSGVLAAGRIKPLYEAFYAQSEAATLRLSPRPAERRAEEGQPLNSPSDDQARAAALCSLVAASSVARSSGTWNSRVAVQNSCHSGVTLSKMIFSSIKIPSVTAKFSCR